MLRPRSCKQVGKLATSLMDLQAGTFGNVGTQFTAIYLGLSGSYHFYQ